MGTRRQYVSAHVVARMTPGEREAALRPGGIAVARLSGDVRSAVLRELDYAFMSRVLRSGTTLPATERDVLRGRLTLARSERPAPAQDAPATFAPDSLRLQSEEGVPLWAPPAFP